MVGDQMELPLMPPVPKPISMAHILASWWYWRVRALADGRPHDISNQPWEVQQFSLRWRAQDDWHKTSSIDELRRIDSIRTERERHGG